MKFIRDTLTTFSAQVLAVLTGVANSIIVARVLGPDGKGAYALVVLVPTFLALLGNMGIGQASVYFGATRRHDWGKLASNSVVSALVFGVVLGSVFLIYFFAAQPSFLSDMEARVILVPLVAVPFSLVSSYFGLILVGQDRIGLYNVLRVAPGMVSLVATVVVLVVLEGGLFSVVLVWTGTTILFAVLSFILAGGTARMAWSFDPKVFRDSVRFGLPVSLGNTIQFLNYRVDMLIVASLMSVASVGYYSVSVAIAETLWYLPAAVGTMVFAKMASVGVEEANRSTPRICRNTLFITAVAGLAMVGVSRYVIGLLYGSDFLPAVEPLWLLIPGVVALTIWKVLPPYMVAMGKPAIMSIGAGISLAVNVFLNFILIPRMGISGAALASTISYSVTAILVLVVFLRMSGSSLVDTLVIKPEDLSAYAGVIVRVSTRLKATVVNARER